jgi:hydroxyacylglutathione hydrolase
MRGIKFLFVTAIVVAAIAAVAVVVMRTGREKFSPATELQPGLYGIQSAGGIYLYAARIPQGVILFDAGADPQAHPIDGLLAGMGSGRGEVRKIFLTHGHFDHVAGVPQLPGAESYLGVADVGLANGTVAPETLVGKLLTKAMRTPPVTITNPLRVATTIDLGGGKTVKAYPVPGHTAGSFAFLYDGVLFAGDMLIVKQGRLETTPAVFDAHPDDNRTAIRSLKTQLAGERLETICTAHGGCTPKGLGGNLLDDLVGRL